MNTSQIDRLSAWLSTGELLAPGGDRPNLVDLTRALALLGGAGMRAAGAGAAGLIAERIGESGHLVCVLVDGLGLSLVERLAAGGFLRQHLSLELRTVFPSATASAITSLVTGEWPCRHAVPGWWAWFREHGLSATTLPFVERFEGRSLTELRIEPGDVFPRRSLLEDYGRESLVVLPQLVVGSAYSRYLCGPAAAAGYGSLPEAVDLVLERVRAATAPTYTLVYVTTVDELCHEQGPEADAVLEHVVEVEAEAARLAGGLAGAGGRLVLTADHGLITVPPEGRHLLTPDDPLIGMLEVPPTGEPRVPLFHVRPGSEPSFRALFLERYGERYALLTGEEAEELELFGPGRTDPAARARLGDLVGIARGPDVLLFRPGEEPTHVEAMRGFHGGLTPDEMRIPLVLA